MYSESKRVSPFGCVEAPHGVRTPIFRNLSNCEQSPGGHRFNLSADVKERCSSGGAAVYSYTGKVVHPPAAPHLLLNVVHTASQAPVRSRWAFVEQPSPEVGQLKSGSTQLTTGAQKPSLVIEQATSSLLFQVP
jgi:hypothetical protein